MRVLVVEDSETVREAIKFRLRKSGYVVDASGDGEEGLWFAESNDYDAVILDLMLPGLDGLTVLSRLRRRRGETPVLLLTVKNEISDRVAGLQAGADDYLSKPFAFDELLARVEALVRRRYGNKQPLIRVGDLELHTAARKFCHLGCDLELTPREYRVLELFVRRKGTVVSRAEIEEHIYGAETEILSNAVESVVSTLRRKLDSAGIAPLIHTRRGMGYVLQTDRE